MASSFHKTLEHSLLYMYMCVVKLVMSDQNCVIFSESIFSTLPFTERGQPMVINGDPQGKNMLYCNGNTVVIRNIEVN